MILNKFQQIYNYLLNLIFGNCIYCNEFINQINKLCDQCESKLIPFSSASCVFCRNSTLCMCVNVSYKILFKYNRIISDIILNFKYNNRYDLSIFFANYMQKYVIYDNQTIIIPIPTSYKKLYKRGYNQSVEICKQLSKLCKIPYNPFILKKTRTTSQQNANYIERIQNASSIEIDNIESIRDKNIIIIDDVIGSGATISRCIHLLKSYVKHIYILAIAKSG